MNNYVFDLQIIIAMSAFNQNYHVTDLHWAMNHIIVVTHNVVGLRSYQSHDF